MDKSKQRKNNFVRIGAVVAIVLALLANVIIITACGNKPDNTVEPPGRTNVQPVTVSTSDTLDTVNAVDTVDTMNAVQTNETSAEEVSSEPVVSVAEEDLIYPKYPYFIEVDKTHQIVTIYTTSFSGKYDKIVRQMLCSTSEDPNKFPDGYWKLKEDRCSAKNVWRKMKSHGTELYAQYATQITGDFLFHSVPYTAKKKTTLDTKRYKKLGTADSGGCIRLSVENAKWICENCAAGTTVHLISKEADPELEALAAELKAALPAVDSSGWDPSDPDPKNPNYHPQFTEPDPEPEGYPVENFEKITYSKEIPYVS